MAYYHRKTHYILITVVVLLTVIACKNTSLINKTNETYLEYMHRITNHAEKFQNNVFKVFCIADYQTYYIPTRKQLQQKDISETILDEYPTRLITESSFATATLLNTQNNIFSFLSCHHFLNYPDTVYYYHAATSHKTNKYLSRVAIKRSQTLFIRDNNFTGIVDVLAIDTINDISLLGATINNNSNNTPSLFYTIDIAKKENIKTGTEVFSFGYPSGYKMMTRALLSRTFDKRPNTFMIDASFHKGYSGAPILIFNMKKNKFEIAGIITSASAEIKNILVPESENYSKQYPLDIPYSEDIYVSIDKKINYGITFTANIDEIKTLYLKNRYILKKKGYNLDKIFINNKINQ